MLNILVSLALIATPVRLDVADFQRVGKDSEQICKALVDQPGPAGPRMDAAAEARGYRLEQKLLLGFLCAAYVQGRIDQMRNER